MFVWGGLRTYVNNQLRHDSSIKMEEENLHQQKNPKPKKQSKLSLGSLGNVNWDWGQT